LAIFKSYAMKKVSQQIVNAPLQLNSITHPAFASDQELFYGKKGTEAHGMGN